jgi:signal transduction histidine kinase
MTRARLARLAGWAVAASTGSLMVSGMAMLLLFVARHPGTLPVQTVMPNLYDVPLVLGFGVVSVVILRRLPRHPIGWLFGLMAVAVAYNTFAGGYSAWDFPATEWVLWVWNVLTGPTFFGMAMALLLFPTGRPGSPRWRWLAWLLWIYMAAEVLVACVSPWPNRVPFVDIEVQAYLGWPHRNPLAWEGQGWLPDAFASASPVGVALILASLLSLLPRWRRATGDERQQIKWLGLAALLLTLEFVGGVSQFATGGPPDDPANQMLGQAVFTLIVAGIPLTIGLGIARYRLYDIDILVSKTIAFGGLVGFIGLAYVVGVVVVGQLVGSTGSSTLPALTATAVVATVFQPLRTWLRSRADRWVFGERAAPYELMTRFGQDLGQTLDSTQILARIAATAAQAVRARSARVTATLPNGEVLTACWPATVSPRSFDIVIPVYHEGATIAEISVVGAGARTADGALLRQIAAVSAAALRNVRLLAELESLHDTLQRQNHEIASSRSRLVAAAGVQRQQLEQVVAQQLGPDLAILRETLPALLADVSDRPNTVDAECERLVAHATRLVDQMRALSRGVLPPVLADHGLAAALRAKLRRVDADVRLEVEQSIIGCRFPAHVETTVYLCCQAAIDAAAADRGTGSAALQLSHHNGDLKFTFTGTDHPGWVNDLVGSRDRITTLGGELTIHRDGQLIAVTGTMPLDREPGQEDNSS